DLLCCGCLYTTNMDTEASKEDNNSVIPETQTSVVITPDEELDEIARSDIQVLKPVWGDLVEGDQSFAPYVSKHKKNKMNKLARSAGQPYNTRSRGVPSHMSL
ncbi:hypothetical protein A2U01_0005374, partial [Trifolium medium]|nr:hypothetical protein [Trifolium medium]